MSDRQFLIAWGGALAIVAAVVIAIFPLSESQPDFEAEQVAVIGSSLTAYAIPLAGAKSPSLLGDGRSHRRIAMPVITEFDTIELAQSAIDDRAAVLVLEIDQFVKTPGSKLSSSPCLGETYALRSIVWKAKRKFTQSARLAAGLKMQDGRFDEPSNLDRTQVIDLDRIRKFKDNPAMHEPECLQELANLIRSARRAGTEIFFIHYPRSQTADAFIGRARTDELRSRTERLAAKLGVPLFSPKEPWPNGQFMDHSHLNREGRARFLAELRSWRRTQS